MTATVAIDKPASIPPSLGFTPPPYALQRDDMPHRLRERELGLSYDRLRETEHRATLAHERQRLMQDMHDGLGSSLTSALHLVRHGKAGTEELAQGWPSAWTTSSWPSTPWNPWTPTCCCWRPCAFGSRRAWRACAWRCAGRCTTFPPAMA